MPIGAGSSLASKRRQMHDLAFVHERGADEVEAVRAVQVLAAWRVHERIGGEAPQVLARRARGRASGGQLWGAARRPRLTALNR